MAETHDRRGAIVAGAILIGLGVAFLAMRFLNFGPGLVLIGLGFAFLAAWAMTKSYGLLVPGGILTGLGAGIALESLGVVPSSVVVLGLGAGFVAIWALDLVWSHVLPLSRGWWPLIPGGVLIAVGAAGSLPQVMLVLQYLWPVALIGAGVFIIWRGLGRREPK